MTAKEQIAEYLYTTVVPILQPPAFQPTAAQVAAAREALYQSMLVTLGTALSTDVIVQFPVDVTSPYGPPHVTGTADGFAQLLYNSPPKGK